jgi:hypothetical protein
VKVAQVLRSDAVGERERGIVVVEPGGSRYSDGRIGTVQRSLFARDKEWQAFNYKERACG